jgi:hypothetical protein
MALTAFQRDVCRVLAVRRRAAGDSYVAGGVALNEALRAHRLSRDLDLFHDSTEAVARAWDADRRTLETHGFRVITLRERPGFVEATVAQGGETLLVEWLRDSAFRFFPLVEHDEFGLTLHPFDLATNKVLALAGRLEVRDWIDVIACDTRLQPLGYLAFAACGKDPGFTPSGLLAEAGRSSHYSEAEVHALAFAGQPPDAAALSRQWHGALRAAGDVISRLPVQHVGTAVLSPEGQLFQGSALELSEALRRGEILFHPGRLGGALPRLVMPDVRD